MVRIFLSSGRENRIFKDAKVSIGLQENMGIVKDLSLAVTSSS